MIKTTELMLGNLVEFAKEYCKVVKIGEEYVDLYYNKDGNTYTNTHCCNINPIPLTDGVLKRLGYKGSTRESVHEFQNWDTINNKSTIDITPLLSPRYTTHDGVEVWDGDLVYYTIINSYINPQQTIVSKSNMDKIGYIFFSTLNACQSYIDKVTRKPVFTTEDGVDVFEGDLYVAVKKSGYYVNGDKSTPYTYKCAINDRKMDCSMYFSTQQLAQAYLNKVSAEKEYNDLMGKKEYNG